MTPKRGNVRIARCGNQGRIPGPTLGAVRLDEMKFIFIQQPGGWPGPKVQTDMPVLVNLRQDPFERTPMLLGETSATGGAVSSGGGAGRIGMLSRFVTTCLGDIAARWT